MAVAFKQRDDELLDMAEVAAVAGVSLATARTWCRTGRLAWTPGARPGQRLVRRSDLRAFLAPETAAKTAPEVAPGGSAQVPAQDSAHEPGLSGIRDQLAGGDALRRLAAEVSGQLDLETLFADVVNDAMRLFSLARMGLWMYDAAHHVGELGD